MKAVCFLLVVLVSSTLVESQGPVVVGGNDMDDVGALRVSPLSRGAYGYNVMPVIGQQRVYRSNDADDRAGFRVNPFLREVSGLGAIPVIGQPVSRGMYRSGDADDHAILRVSSVSRDAYGLRAVPVISRSLSSRVYQPMSGVSYRSIYSVPSNSLRQIYSQPLILGSSSYRPLVSRRAPRRMFRSAIVRRRTVPLTSYCC